MDSLTHIVAGACIGHLIAGKEMGKKALIAGAIANSLPDIDFIASFFLPLTSDLLAHRGFTHSFLFIVLCSPFLAWVSTRVFRKVPMTYGRWGFFWAFQCFIHIFIDAFNAYGTAWFEPFSHYRVAFNTMFVADPLFTIWPAIAMVVLFAMGTANKNRTLIAGLALALSGCYLVAGIFFKNIIDRRVHEDLNKMNAGAQRYFSAPTPLNNILWYVVAQHDSGYYIGYRSLFDNKPTDFRFVCRNTALLNSAPNKDDIDKLIRFSSGFYTVEKVHDTLKFNDLRFGEILGWDDSVSHCVFYYYPEHPDANELIVQRGRFAKWDGQSFRNFLRRIAGR